MKNNHIIGGKDLNGHNFERGADVLARYGMLWVDMKYMKVLAYCTSVGCSGDNSDLLYD